jgi:putative toxin-antitoxin system antitoxin component (TIGR02293 family)
MGYSIGHVPPAGEDLKPQEGERVERRARVITTAEHVWGSVDDARAFLSTAHAMLGGKRPIEVALAELGSTRSVRSARRWKGRLEFARTRCRV